MTKIDFDKISEEVISILEKEQSIVLATAANDKVTARTISHVNDGLTIYFQTGTSSEKFQQMKSNPNTAFAVGNMQIEAVVEICGHPNKNPHFIELYKAKFPRYFELYTNHEDEIVIKAIPQKVKFWKYFDGAPCCEMVDLIHRKAYRENHS